MTLKKWLSLMLACLLALGALTALAEVTAAPEAEEAAQQTEEQAVEQADEQAAEQEFENPFPLMIINDMNGQPFDAGVFDGKPIMFNFWASWCPPCLAEMPDLNELAVEYADRLTLVGIMSDAVRIDGQGQLQLQPDEIEGAKKVYADKGITYPSLIPDELMMYLMQYLNMQSIPTTLFVDGDGMLIDLQVGARSKEQWQGIMDVALEKMAARQSD